MVFDYGDWKRVYVVTNHGHEFGPEMQRSFVEWEGKEGARPKSRIPIAVRQFDDFENALTEEISVYSRLNPSCGVEAVPFDVECLCAISARPKQS
jgi:hypothetical protein